MDYIENWEKARERFCAFWENELTDRCCATVIAPKYPEMAGLEKVFPESGEERFLYWTDPEWILGRYKMMFENVHYFGEAFPLVFLELGTAGHAGFFKNANARFEDTVWMMPFLKDWEKDELVRPLMEELSSRGLFLISYASSREEAHSVMDIVQKLTHV